MRIGVYIDGFNLYYGLFKHGPPVCRQYKWLNPFLLGQEMATRLKLSGDVTRVRYFTSRAKHNPEDPGQPTRQQMLVRAMETLPEVSVHWGQHIDTVKRGFLVGDPDKAIRNFSTREEKGSDVSLGVFMTRDIALKEIDVVLLVSNDSDLVNAVSVAEADFNTRVYIVSPQPSGNPSRKLREAASGLIIVDPDCLAKCQFANPVVDGLGRKIHKPDRW
ncbi:MAG: NYN domain-containing protein [Chloroflexia bacterium]|nr:NYN domain-containing protein [Chloroflexia bacterium]